VTDGEGYSGFPAGRDHPITLPDVAGHDLLDHNVLAGASGCDRCGHVQVVGQQDIHSVHVLGHGHIAVVFLQAQVIAQQLPDAFVLGFVRLGHGHYCA